MSASRALAKTCRNGPRRRRLALPRLAPVPALHLRGPGRLYGRSTEAEEESVADILLSPARFPDCPHSTRAFPVSLLRVAGQRPGTPLCISAVRKRLLGSSFSISSASLHPS